MRFSLRRLLVPGILLAVAVVAWICRPGRTQGPAAAASRSGGSEERPSLPLPLSSVHVALLESGSLEELSAAGVPRDVARQLLAGRAYVRMRSKLESVVKASAQTEYWKGMGDWFSPENKQRRRAYMDVPNEYAQTLRDLFGGDASIIPGSDPRFASLSPAKREILRRIEQDYGEMQAELYSEMAGLSLPVDQERLKLLETEKQRDILAALTPEEAEAFKLRGSQTAQMIQNEYGSAIKSEADYRKIFALRQAFEDRFSMQTFYVGNHSARDNEP